MKLLSWHPSGLGNPLGVQNLQELLKKENLDIIFLHETKVLASYFNSCMFSFGFPNCLAIDRVGLEGRLVLLWKKEVVIEILFYSRDFIHEQIINRPKEDQIWLFTRIYEILEVEKRKETWSLIKSLCSNFEIPSLVMDGFNKILSQEEKWGGWSCLEGQMEEFRNVLSECDLKDLGYTRTNFTWCNRRKGVNKIYERLDRRLANSKWCLMFSESSISHGTTTSSNKWTTFSFV